MFVPSAAASLPSANCLWATKAAGASCSRMQLVLQADQQWSGFVNSKTKSRRQQQPGVHASPNRGTSAQCPVATQRSVVQVAGQLSVPLPFDQSRTAQQLYGGRLSCTQIQHRFRCQLGFKCQLCRGMDRSPGGGGVLGGAAIEPWGRAQCAFAGGGGC